VRERGKGRVEGETAEAAARAAGLESCTANAMRSNQQSSAR